MAFTESDHQEELKEESSSKKIIIGIISILLLIGIIIFCYCYFFNSNKNKEVEKTNIENIEKELSGDEDVNKNSEELTSILEAVYEKEIFQLTSSKPTGFYVMVGTFLDYENAVRLESSNPTDFTCHIFEPNEEYLNRVGLFVSETDVGMAEMVLNEVRNMVNDSWLLYNTQY